MAAHDFVKKEPLYLDLILGTYFICGPPIRKMSGIITIASRQIPRTALRTLNNTIEKNLIGVS